MNQIASRKGEHLQVITTRDVDTRTRAGWDDVRLVHQALPEIDVDDVDPSVTFLGHRLRYPIIVASMTGGHPEAFDINRTLALVAEELGIGMGVGSQRAALRDSELRPTYAVVREAAPTAFIVANIGAPQLIPQDGTPPLGPRDVAAALEMVAADALAVHLNFLEETVMTEGDRRARGCTEAIAELAASLPVPVIGKETGAGLSREAACLLRRAGVGALDVGGVGGTSFAAVEGYRAERIDDRRGMALGEVFRDWGLPTAVSLVQVSGAGLPTIATGGIRTGLDAAKALALGAELVGVARPLLQAAQGGPDAVRVWFRQFFAELQAAMFLTGARTVPDLRTRPRVILGETGEWLRQLALPFQP